MNDYIALPEAPVWCIAYPTCSACDVDLEVDDAWTCPCCGTRWDSNANDGDEGDLYADWSGEQPGGPAVATEDAYFWGTYLERLESHKRFPELVAEPKRPLVRSEAAQ